MNGGRWKTWSRFVDSIDSLSYAHVQQAEKLLAVKKGRKSVGTTKPEPWLERTTTIFAQIDVKPPSLMTSQMPTPARSLRSTASSTTTSPPSTKGRRAPPATKTLLVAPSRIKQTVPLDVQQPESPLTEASDDDSLITTEATKKLPRVILHVRPPTSSSSAL